MRFEVFLRCLNGSPSGQQKYGEQQQRENSVVSVPNGRRVSANFALALKFHAHDKSSNDRASNELSRLPTSGW
jgi:hypothetical protein